MQGFVCQPHAGICGFRIEMISKKNKIDSPSIGFTYTVGWYPVRSIFDHRCKVVKVPFSE